MVIEIKTFNNTI